MKKKIIIYIIIVLVSVGIIWISGLLLLFGCSGVGAIFGFYKNIMLEYYDNEDNYFQYTGTVSNIEMYGEDYCIQIENIYLHDKNEECLSINKYRIVFENAEILRTNDFFKEVQNYEEITFKVAHHMWKGEEYLPPIAAIWCNDKCYLDFEVGKQNILNYVEKTEK